MSWIALTSDHVKARLAEDELTEIEGTGGGDGDRLTGVIAQVTSLVRAKVAACHKNTPGESLGPAGTIPDECLHAAATLAKHDIRASLPTTGGDEEKKLRATIAAFLELSRVSSARAITTRSSSKSKRSSSDRMGGQRE